MYASDADDLGCWWLLEGSLLARTEVEKERVGLGRNTAN